MTTISCSAIGRGSLAPNGKASTSPDDRTLMKIAAWIAGALAFGWLATAGALAVPGGHPPLAYFVGGGVVLVSFLIAPIGAGAALAELWRARRRAIKAPRLAVAA